MGRRLPAVGGDVAAHGGGVPAGQGVDVRHGVGAARVGVDGVGGVGAEGVPNVSGGGGWCPCRVGGVWSCSRK